MIKHCSDKINPAIEDNPPYIQCQSSTTLREEIEHSAGTLSARIIERASVTLSSREKRESQFVISPERGTETFLQRGKFDFIMTMFR